MSDIAVALMCFAAVGIAQAALGWYAVRAGHDAVKSATALITLTMERIDLITERLDEQNDEPARPAATRDDLVRLRKELDMAEYGEGVEFNLRFIIRDLDNLIALSDPAPANEGEAGR